MRIRPWMAAVLLGLVTVGGVHADEEAGGGRDEIQSDERVAVTSRALEVMRVRMEARLMAADALRELGRFDEALEVLRAVDEIYGQGMAEIDRLLDRIEAGGAPRAGGPAAPTTLDPRGAVVGRGPGPGRTDSKASLDPGLRWLAAHQSPGGRWEAAGFGAWCDGAPVARGPDGAGKEVYDVGVTGLALCAFLGAGYTHRGDHEFAEVVADGLRYLKSVQDPEGCFGPRNSQHFVYNHATASLAMVEAYGLTSSPLLKPSAQKALDFIALARNPYFAWRYGVRPGDNDTSVTGWMVMVLASAKRINEAAVRRLGEPPLVLDEAAFDGVRTLLDKLTDPEYGRVGYIQRGGAPARPQALIDRFPADKSESMTAVAILMRVLMGEDPRSSSIVRKGGKLLEKVPPVWNPNDGSIDMYYWYFGSLAAREVGGRTWKRWREGIKRAVVDNQRKDTTPCLYRGSWDPIGPWGPDGGRVYATALMTLVKQLYYRSE